MNPSLIESITKQVLAEMRVSSSASPAIPIGISARHVHLSKQDFEICFGQHAELTIRNPLSMLQEFAANETVTIVSEQLKSIERVRILGPFRASSQVEISRTDAYQLGIDPPVRASGDIAGSAPITIVGPKGSVTLREGCIIANRHIHFSPEEAIRFRVQDGQLVDVKCTGNGKSTILLDVLVRVKNTYTLEMHLDLDDGNALGIRSGDMAEIVKL